MRRRGRVRAKSQDCSRLTETVADSDNVAIPICAGRRSIARRTIRRRATQSIGRQPFVDHDTRGRRPGPGRPRQRQPRLTRLCRTSPGSGRGLARAVSAFGAGGRRIVHAWTPGKTLIMNELMPPRFCGAFLREPVSAGPWSFPRDRLRLGANPYGHLPYQAGPRRPHRCKRPAWSRLRRRCDVTVEPSAGFRCLSATSIGRWTWRTN